MTKLKTLDLSLNNLQVLSVGQLSGLRLDYLYLEGNPKLRLRDSVFNGMSTGLLSLKDCDLTTIEPGIFSPLRGSLRKLKLDNNKIERFDSNMLSVFQELEYLRIHNNPLICDCESKWLKEFYDLNKAKVRDGSQGNSEEPRCAAPDHVAGLFFFSVSAYDFSCAKPTLSANISFTKTKGVLSCVSRGNPLPTVSWYRPNGDIQHSEPRGNMVANTNEIQLQATDSSVKGQYSCVASNDGGNISFTVNVDWPFEQEEVAVEGNTVGCNPAIIQPEAVDDNDVATKSGLEAEKDGEQTGSVLDKHFTLLDLISGILGTFVCTLVITVVTLHFCVYRKKLDSHYSTAPPMSEYSSGSSSSSSDKPSSYPPTSFMPVHNHHQQMVPPQRPLPLPKFYDDYHHYMATSIDERDGFLNNTVTSPRASSQGRATPSCDSCLACRTLASSSGNTSNPLS